MCEINQDSIAKDQKCIHKSLRRTSVSYAEAKILELIVQDIRGEE